MTRISREEIKALAENAAAPCVSIYMPVMKKGVPELRQNPVRLKNMLRQAGEQIGKEHQSVIEAGHAVADDITAWEHPGESFALFLTPSLTRHYQIPIRTEEILTVGAHLHLAPLLEMCVAEGRFWVLALSQKQLRLIACSRSSAQQVKIPLGVPESLVESLEHRNPDVLDERTRANPVGKPNLLGHHNEKVDKNTVIEEYCRQIDRGLHDAMFKEQHNPLVLACVEYVRPLYYAVNTYPHLAEESIAGNPEGFSPEELREKAWPIVEPMLNADMQKALQRFGERTSDGRASKALKEIVQAAMGGRVESLFVASGIHQWGVVEPERLKIHQHKEPRHGDRDLVDVAALQTFLHGGRVYTLEQEEIPGGAPVAAVFRF